MYKLLMKVTYVRGRGFGASKLTATRYRLCMIVSHGTKEGEGPGSAVNVIMMVIS